MLWNIFRLDAVIVFFLFSLSWPKAKNKIKYDDTEKPSPENFPLSEHLKEQFYLWLLQSPDMLHSFQKCFKKHLKKTFQLLHM